MMDLWGNAHETCIPVSSIEVNNVPDAVLGNRRLCHIIMMPEKMCHQFETYHSEVKGMCTASVDTEEDFNSQELLSLLQAEIKRPLKNRWVVIFSINRHHAITNLSKNWLGSSFSFTQKAHEKPFPTT